MGCHYRRSNGNDKIWGSLWSDQISSGRGNDRIWALTGNDFVDAGSGNDWVDGGWGNDTILGGSGNDHLYGDWGADRIDGGSGNDRISGGFGNDRLIGGEGADDLDGGWGNDELVIKAANVGRGRDRYEGGKGIDTLIIELKVAEYTEALRAEILAFIDWADGRTGWFGEVRSGKFRFTELNLEVREIERVEVFVDGVRVDPRDPIGQTPDPVARDDQFMLAEDASLSASVAGNDDVPNGAVFTLISGVSGGLLTLNSDGSFEYEASGFDYLGAGETTSVSFAYSLAVGGNSDTAEVTLTVTGTNDGATVNLAGGADLSVAEDSDSVASGVLSVSDLDAGEAQVDPASATQPLYGSFFIDLAGVWSYTLNQQNPAVQALPAGASLSDTITVASLDGTGLIDITVVITGTNDAAVIAPAAGADLSATEDSDSTASGQLLVSDADEGEAAIDTESATAALFGDFSIAAEGSWNYLLDQSNPQVQALAAGATLTDSVSVTSLDGTASSTLDIVITGTNDVATVSLAPGGDLDVTEDTDSTASGRVVVSDVDSGQSAIDPASATSPLYGAFSIDADGNWTYTLNSALPAVQALGAGAALTDVITVSSLDGTGSAYILVMIAGTNDAPRLITSAGPQQASAGEAFDLAIARDAFADVDAGDSLTLSASLEDGGKLPGWLQFDAATGQFFGTPSAADGGSFTVALTATDSQGESAVDLITFDVLGGEPPAIAQLRLAAVDSDGAGNTTAATVTLVGSADAGDRVNLFDGDGTTLLATTIANNEGQFRFTGIELELGENAFETETIDAESGLTARSEDQSFVRLDDAGEPVNAALFWTQVALDAVAGAGVSPNFASRAMAMESQAVFNVIAAIEGTPGYGSNADAADGASVEAGIAQAAYAVLSYLFPSQRAMLDAALDSRLAGIGEGLQEGLDLGVEVAQFILDIRDEDGWNVSITETGRDEDGVWRPTGPGFRPGQDPQWGDVDPFVVDNVETYRPDAPPSILTDTITDDAYASDYERTIELGSSTSTDRTADQTQIAKFWADGPGTHTPSGHWTQIAAQIADAEGLSLSATANLMLQLNLAMADAGIAAFDTKYAYDVWRPLTVTTEGGEVDGVEIAPVDGWKPFVATPNHPEYVSGHSTYSAAGATVLTAFFGEDYAFSTSTLSIVTPTLRDFDSFWAAAEEAGASRIYGGIHWEFSNVAGQALGEAIANAVLTAFDSAEDVVAPTVYLQQDESGGALAPVFNGFVFDNLSGVESLRVAIDDGAFFDVAVLPNGAFSIATDLALDGSDDGLHELSFLAVDAVGNREYGEATFFHFAGLPDIELLGDLAGGTADAETRLLGSVELGGGNSLASLSYAIDGGDPLSIIYGAPETIAFFNTEFDIGDLRAGSHTLAITAIDVFGNTVTEEFGFALAADPLLTITNLAPSQGEDGVALTFRPLIEFSTAVDVSTLTEATLFATDAAGQALGMRIVPLDNGDGAWLFFDDVLPGNQTITLNIDGDGIFTVDGRALDADGDGVAGGDLAQSFTTLSDAPVAGTTLVGRILDPGADYHPMTPDDFSAGPAGPTDWDNNQYFNPLANVEVYILGREGEAVFTDENGYFELTNVPAGSIKVAVDGRTSSNAPDGFFFPEMVMDVRITPGVENTIMAGMGPRESRAANIGNEAVYLPRIDEAILVDIADSGTTTVRAVAENGTTLTQEQLGLISLEVVGGSLVDENGDVIQGAQVGVSTVPPDMVRDMLPEGVLQHTFDITIQTPGGAVFTEEAQITMPNIFGMAPGEKTFILSFDHTTGELVIDGTATVSEDGLTIVSDPGSGIDQPGWHGVTPPGTQKSFDERLAEIEKRLLALESANDETSQSINETIEKIQEINSRPTAAEIKLEKFKQALANTSDTNITPLLEFFKEENPNAYKALEITGQIDPIKKPFEKAASYEKHKSDIAEAINVFAQGYYGGDPGKYHGEIDANWLSIAAGGVVKETSELTLELLLDMSAAKGLSPKALAEASAKSINQQSAEYVIGQLFDKLLELSVAGADAHYQSQVPPNTNMQLRMAPQSLSSSTKAEPSLLLAAATEEPQPTALAAFQEESIPTFYDFTDLTEFADSVQSTLLQIAASEPLLDTGLVQAELDQLVTLLADYEALKADTQPLVTEALAALQQLSIIFGQLETGTFPGTQQEMIDQVTGLNTTVADNMVAVAELGSLPETVFLIEYRAALLKEAYTQLALDYAATLDGVDALDGTGGATTNYYAIFYNVDDEKELRVSFDLNGRFDIVLEPETSYKVAVFNPLANTIGSLIFETESSGTIDTDALLPLLLPDQGELGVNGLSEFASYIVGADPDILDSLSPGSGISDAELLRSGLIDDIQLPSVTGPVGSVSLLGEALTVELADVGEGPMAFVATGSHGLAVLDLANARQPVVLAELDLPGNAVDIAVGQGGFAALALEDGGVAVIDLADPAAPQLAYTIDGIASQVEIADNLLIAAFDGQISLTHLASGVEISTLDLGTFEVEAMAFAEGHLYVVTNNQQLTIYALEDFALSQLGSLGTSGFIVDGGNRMVVDGDVLFMGAAFQTGEDVSFGGGTVTIDISNKFAPFYLADIAGAEDITTAGEAIALNGSGLGVGVQDFELVDGSRVDVIDVVRMDDTSDPAQFVSRIQFDSALGYNLSDVDLTGNLAYVAAGMGGVQVVAYQPVDGDGIAPTVSLNALPADADALADGLQLVEGTPLALSVSVTDDNAVARTELLINGEVALSDISFPWNLATILPTLDQQGGTSALTLQVRAVDTGGNIGLSELLEIELIADDSPFEITAIRPPAGLPLFEGRNLFTLDFSKIIDPSSIDASDFALVGPGGGTVDPTSFDLSNVNRTVTLSFDIPTLETGDYTLTVNAASIADLEGTLLGAGALQFTYGESDADISWISPVDGSWTDGANWSTGIAPADGDNVLVAPTDGVTASIQGNVGSITGLIVDGAGTLQLSPDGSSSRLTTDSLINRGDIKLGNFSQLDVENVLSNQSLLTIQAGGQLRASNGIANSDTILVQGALGSEGRLVTDAAESFLSGGGTIELAGGALRGSGFPTLDETTNQIVFPQKLTNIDNTITGTGTVGAGFEFINEADGLIVAGDGDVLRFAAGRAENNGIMRADAGGVLELNSAEFYPGGIFAFRGPLFLDNADGVISTDGGTIDLSDARISGGLIASTGVVDGGGIRFTPPDELPDSYIDLGDAGLFGDESKLTLQGPAIGNGYTQLQGAIANTDLIWLEPAIDEFDPEFGFDSNMTLFSDVTLDGGGTIYLGSEMVTDYDTGELVEVHAVIDSDIFFEDYFEEVDPETGEIYYGEVTYTYGYTLTNVDNEITGSGWIGAKGIDEYNEGFIDYTQLPDFTLVNQFGGSIVATNGDTLTINYATVFNSGLMTADFGSTLKIMESYVLNEASGFIGLSGTLDTTELTFLDNDGMIELYGGSLLAYSFRNNGSLELRFGAEAELGPNLLGTGSILVSDSKLTLTNATDQSIDMGEGAAELVLDIFDTGFSTFSGDVNGLITDFQGDDTIEAELFEFSFLVTAEYVGDGFGGTLTLTDGVDILELELAYSSEVEALNGPDASDLFQLLQGQDGGTIINPLIEPNIDIVF